MTPNGATTTIESDPLGRRFAEHSPDRGDITFAYDKANNLIQRTDARGVAKTMAYDALNRAIAVDYPGDAEHVTRRYEVRHIELGTEYTPALQKFGLDATGFS